MPPQKKTKEVPVNKQDELTQHGALAKAIASAAVDAAGDISSDTLYKVDEILVLVSPNPGPKTYTVTIVPK